MDNLKTYTDLLSIIKNHTDLIASQNNMIKDLIKHLEGVFFMPFF